jgi:hypothetical protein
MNKDVFTAGCSDGCGCFSHEEKLNFGEDKLDVFTAGCSDGCGCFSHKEILIA